MPTLIAVHAHPDDEASSTGGVLARYSAQGFTTVVVTCTNGELGDMPGGTKPGEDGHDEEHVVSVRRAELAKACEILGVTHLEMLGYRDSGMADWENQSHPDAFCNVPADVAVARICEIYEHYQPDVVVTYNQQSAYNHPDHIQASRIAMAAADLTQIPKKVYLTAMRANRFSKIRELLVESGVELPPVPERPPEWVKKMEEQEARITTTVDVAQYVEQKLDALRAHSSQIQNFFWNQLPTEALTAVFGQESFIRSYDETSTRTPETDLFAGI